MLRQVRVWSIRLRDTLKFHKSTQLQISGVKLLKKCATIKLTIRVYMLAEAF